ncbi:hypothetical protein JCM11491_003406 [Sporobolomyces phaffii]
MNGERDTGDPGQFQLGQSSNPSSFLTSPHLSSHLVQPPAPLQHAQPFIPYSPFLSDASVVGLPTPPPPLSATSASGSFTFSPVDTTSPAFPLPHPGHNELSPLMTNMFGAALTSPGSTGPTTFGHGTESAESPGGPRDTNANGGKIVQKADRSCKKCRERRVRCDRHFPKCERCLKRREECSYGTGVFIETVEEGSDAAKIAELESKVAALETQLKTASSNNSKTSGSNFPRSTPTPPNSLSNLARESLAAVVAHAVTAGLSLEERNILDQLLSQQDQNSLYGSVPDQRGGGGSSRKDIGITSFLLDSSTKACCTKLPGLHLLRDRLPYFKANINSLDPPHRLAVICMCAIGVRVYPASALFGISSVTQHDGTPIPQLFRTVGARRDKICQSLCKVAIETAWGTGVVREKSYENLDALVGLVQYLIHEEGKPEEARFFVRELVGMYLDLRHEELSAGVPTKLNEANTTAVFLADGAVSSTCHKPSFITPIDLQDYFASGGLRVPDLVNLQLGEIIEEQLGAPLNRPSILHMLTSLCLYVFSCHRVFSQVSNPRRPSGSSILPFLRNLWSVLDQIHQAVQRLQQHLVNLSSAPQGFVDDPQAIDHAILLAVRADNSLVDLIFLVHVHLKDKYSESTFFPEKDGDEELERMRAESSMRVFKCLKLLAFYCQLYLASQDKHNVFHLILRLELLPNWTTMVAARIGAPDGPISEEFEATQEELDWFRCALELACYYSPQATARLDSLHTARRDSSSYSAPSPRNQQQAQMHHQQQQYDTPPTSSSTLYTSAPTSSSATFATSRPCHQQQPSLPVPVSSIPLITPFDDATTPSSVTASNGVVATEDFAMNPRTPSPTASPPVSSSISGFADGAGQDVTGGSTDAVKNAFRSLDWVDLSLTPAMGSGSDGSSVDGGGDTFKVRKKRPS